MADLTGLVQLARGSLQRRGLATTLRIAAGTALDLEFDWRFGTDTFAMRRLGDLEIASQSASRGRAYQATPARPFRRLMRAVPLPRDCTFVDFGCGKGRALLLAALAGFDRVVGIEFAPALCEIARTNVAHFRRRSGSEAEIEVLEGDVLEYPVSADDRVFFFFNPFDAVVFAAVLARIEASLAAHPRPAWLVYHNPVERIELERSSRFRLHSQHEFWGAEFVVWESSE